jgi:transcriptional antiterminator NusG
MTNEKTVISKNSFNVDEAKWYIIRGHSGAETKIIEDIKKNALLYKVPADDFVDFCVPSVAVETFKQNVKVIVQKSIYPGYIIVKMKMNERSWLVVTKTDKVSGFLGGSRGKPTPLTDSEYQAMLSSIETENIAAVKASNVAVGSRIKVKSGSFESFEGMVKSIDDKNEILTVAVSIFDRETTIELRPDQVEMVNEKL